MSDFIAFLEYFTESFSSNGRKTTFEWPKVSEVSFPRFLGVLWGGLFSGIFRFGDRKCRFRDIAIRPNSAIATYETYVFSKSPNGPILKFLLVTGEVIVLSELLSDLPVLFFCWPRSGGRYSCFAEDYYKTRSAIIRFGQTIGEIQNAVILP